MPTIWTFVAPPPSWSVRPPHYLRAVSLTADPAPAPAPAPNIPQQLISSAANAPQILQNLATALGATPPLSAPSWNPPRRPGITAPFRTDAGRTGGAALR